MAIQIARLEHSPAELRHKARVASDPYQARRLLAIASILEGASRTDAARSAGMERQTLRDWVHRYNAEGVEGLKDRLRAGRKPLLDGEQHSELDRLVETAPAPVKDGVVRWRCADLKAQIKSRFGVEISERSLGRILNARGFRKLSARPRHPKADEASQQTSRTIFPGS
jgi:transposase